MPNTNKKVPNKKPFIAPDDFAGVLKKVKETADKKRIAKSKAPRK